MQEKSVDWEWWDSAVRWWRNLSGRLEYQEPRHELLQGTGHHLLCQERVGSNGPDGNREEAGEHRTQQW